jgi:peptidyl-prolyl cis-trans isomerase B (cyclophilin B)
LFKANFGDRLRSWPAPGLTVFCLTVFLTIFTLILAANPAQAERRNPMVKLTTSMGDITVELFEDKAPESVANFLAYVKDGFYAGTVFHRVIPGFMVQGGGMNKDLHPKPTKDQIRNEADNGLKNEKYTLAMARTPDPHSASSQFFINVADNEFLNFAARTPQGWGYAVFGKVVDGTDVVDKIAAVPTGRQGYHEDVPKEPVLIEKAEVLEK